MSDFSKTHFPKSNQNIVTLQVDYYMNEVEICVIPLYGNHTTAYLVFPLVGENGKVKYA